MSFRDNGLTALTTVLKKEQNIKIIEKNIYEQSVEDDQTEEELEKKYTQYIYQTVGDILNGIKLKDLLVTIKDKKFDWEHDTFYEVRNRITEQDGFIEKPFEVEEGILQCRAVDKVTGKMCGSKRVFSYSRQTRSCDEPSTTFATCSACGSRWAYSG